MFCEDATCLITAKTVLNLAKCAKELFLTSKLGEKQQLLNFVFSNFQLKGKSLLVTLREPLPHCHSTRRSPDARFELATKD